MGDTAYILHPEYCDLCKSQGLQVQAVYDGKTVHGPWAYMCEEHFGAMGVGLGTGRGQRLIVGEKPEKEKSSPYQITEVDDEDDTDETLACNVDEANPSETISDREEGESSSESPNQDSETTDRESVPSNSREDELSGQEPETDTQPIELVKVSNGVPYPKKLDWGNLYP